MSRRVFVLAGVALAVAGVTAGCGSSDRPRDLTLDDVPPCDLVSSSTLFNLGVTAEPRPVQAVEGVDEEGTSCYYTPRSGGDYSVATVTNQGIDRWTNGSMESSKVIDQPRVQGYRTIKVETLSSSDEPHEMCLLYVDVASGQSLKAEAGENSEDDLPTCEIARRLAANAVRSLGG